MCASRTGVLGLALLFCAGVPGGSPVPIAGAAEGSSQADPFVDGARHFALPVSAVPGSYYILERSVSLSGPWEAQAILANRSGVHPLRDPGSMHARAYYRARSVPVASPLDSDGDGIDDLTEILAGAAANPLNPAQPPPPEDAAVILPDRAAFEAYSHRDNFPGAPDVREVKFLITDVDTPSPKLYFLRTSKHKYHYYFAQGVLGYTGSLGQFNSETYFTDGRRFLAGSLIAYDHYAPPQTGPPGLYAVEFWPTDAVSYPHVKMAYDLVTRAMPWVTSRIAWHPAGVTHTQVLRNQAAEFAAGTVDVVTSDELFASTTFGVLNPGVSFGRLVIAPSVTAVTSRDIVVLATPPPDLSRVAGILTAAPQTPLSHLNLKAKQNRTPNAWMRSALSDPAILALAGKNVRYEAGADGVRITEATPQEVDEWLESLRPKDPQIPERDLSIRAIRPLRDIPFSASSSVGAKAANLAELVRLLPQGMAPDGYAVPFSFYDAFMKHNGFYDAAKRMMDEEAFRDDPAVREARLATFRKSIERGDIPDWIRSAIAGVQAEFPAGVPIRCRSSTTNEDLPGFNGAGLYDSNTHRPDEGPLWRSVRKVWASLWNYRAFEEREFHRIDHMAAAMGVLLHPNFDDERANGVAVTKNLIDPNWTGYYVNVQKGEELVTNPDGSVIPEEFLVASLLGTDRYEIQHVTWSSLMPPQTSLLTPEQVWELADSMGLIQSRFRSLYAPSDPGFAMEIEFKITVDNRLVIKQARPWVE